MIDQWTTPWYPGDVKPVRVGVYERRFAGYTDFSRWDGFYWGGSSLDPHEAASTVGFSLFQHKPWRGLTKEAK